jgi:glycogen debranching enzyme
MRKSQPPTDIREVQFIKHDRAFFASDRFGQVPAENRAGLGLYVRDTRFLSRLELGLDELDPILLHSAAELNYKHAVVLAYPLPAGHLSVARNRVMSDSLIEQIEVTNHSPTATTVHMCLDFGSDFLDVREVRGEARETAQPGQALPAQVGRNSVALGYRGADGWVRTTTIRFSPAPESLTPSRAIFEFVLEQGQGFELTLEVTPELGSARPPRRTYREAELRLEQLYTGWRKRCTRFRSVSDRLSRNLDRAILDLRMLLSDDEQGGQHLDAGLPWNAGLFGRDSLIAAYESLGLNLDLAWTVLRRLAALQGTREDPRSGEQPGKIVREVRTGELAAAGEFPDRSYGSVDTTPLWLVLLTYAYSWTADLAAVRSLWPNALAALAWIDLYGDAYVECEADSPDRAVVYPDGSPVAGSVALVEVQGYVYQAKDRLAVLAEAMGEAELAARLRREAAESKARFNRDFWMEELGYPALALDGDGRQIATIASNPGHCLWSGILDDEKSARVARTLLGPGLSSGWGIRTLAAKQAAFDPMGRYTGSVWPGDNALIAHGLKLSGFDALAARAIDQLWAAGAHFALGRLPELFCGFSREEVPVPVEHPMACRPQASAAAAPLLMLRSYLGMSADAPNGVLSIVRPQLPTWVDRIEMIGMRVGQARVDLAFSQRDGVTAVQVVRKEGDLDVVVRQ